MNRFRSSPLLSVLGAATIACALSLSAGADAREAGQPAPAFELPGAGGTLRLADLKGKVVYVDFWASWCGPCKESFPWMNDMQARYGGKGFEIVAVSVDRKREDAERFLAANPAKFRVAFDTSGKTPELYAVKAMPTSYLIGPDGKVLYVHGGFSESAKADLEARIRQALGVK